MPPVLPLFMPTRRYTGRHIARRRAKGGNGAGGISKRKDGLYVGRVTVGWEVVDGRRKQVRKAVYGRTIADVQAKLIEVQAQDHRGVLPALRGRGRTVARFAAEWLAGIEERVRPRSLLRYRELLELHVVPAVGSTPLTKLSVDQVNRLLSQKAKAGLSARTCNYIRGTLRTMLREAERRDLVARNLAALARPLPETKTEPEVLTEAAARLVLEAAETDPDGPLWVLGLTTG